jgi:type II secretory pathway predicted ATPase ExeA
MDLDTAGLHKDAYRLHGKPLTFVRYAAQNGALEFLHDVCANEHGLGVLKGRSLSGKTTVVKQFIEELPAATAVAMIDCKDLDTSAFLSSILAQFGFELDAPTINEQMNFLKVFLVQQTSTNRAPLLFVDNAHEMDSIAASGQHAN